MTGGVASTVATAVLTGSPAMAHVVPPGLYTALAHVPAWTHAHGVLSSKLVLYTWNGAIGTTAAGASGFAAKKLGLKRVLTSRISDPTCV